LGLYQKKKYEIFFIILCGDWSCHVIIQYSILGVFLVCGTRNGYLSKSVGNTHVTSGSLIQGVDSISRVNKVRK